LRPRLGSCIFIAMFGLRRQKSKRPILPEGIRIYAIGDIHGRVDLLEELLARIEADSADFARNRMLLIFIGDYIDRGPASRQVVECLIERSKTQQMLFLRGNHETYITEFLHDPAVLSEWRQFGGLETLVSYGLKPSLTPPPAEELKLATALANALPASHGKFFRNLATSFTLGDFFFVHAGVRPRVPLDQQHEDDLLWIRDEFLLYEEDFGKLIIHGHTPVSEPDIRPNRINIDTGAYATGRLTGIVIEGDQIAVI
jgi:serine/threonine protein phosphatase 1